MAKQRQWITINDFLKGVKEGAYFAHFVDSEHYWNFNYCLSYRMTRRTGIRYIPRFAVTRTQYKRYWKRDNYRIVAEAVFKNKHILLIE